MIVNDVAETVGQNNCKKISLEQTAPKEQVK
jgi:hypothetical protein